MEIAVSHDVMFLDSVLASVLLHRAGSSDNSAFYNGFATVVREEIYFEAYRNGQYIWHKNSITQLYLILGIAELRWNFSSILKDGFDIHRFSKQDVGLNSVHCWKSVNIRGIPESTGKVSTQQHSII